MSNLAGRTVLLTSDLYFPFNEVAGSARDFCLRSLAIFVALVSNICPLIQRDGRHNSLFHLFAAFIRISFLVKMQFSARAPFAIRERDTTPAAIRRWSRS